MCIYLVKYGVKHRAPFLSYFFVHRYLLGDDGLADAFVAEHVWEHLSLADAHRAAQNCHRYLRPGGRLRLAVPDPAWFISKTSSIAGANKGTPECRSKLHKLGTSCREGGDTNNRERGDVTEPRGSREETSRREGVVRLPRWLNNEMLAADARDGHLVEYTPELIANVCWSAGFTPTLIEGGSLAAQTAAPSNLEAAETTLGGKKLETGNADEGDKDADGSEAQQLQQEPFSRTGFKHAQAREEHLWGRIRRSAAGGDSRGAVSMVIDCVKPRNGKEDESPETVTVVGNIVPHQPGGRQSVVDDASAETNAVRLSSASPLRGRKAGLATQDKPTFASEIGGVLNSGYTFGGILGGAAVGNGVVAAGVPLDGDRGNVLRAAECSRADKKILGGRGLFGENGGPSLDAARSGEGGYV